MKIVVLFAIASLAAAQDRTGNLSGTVMDSVTHQPVSRANISLTRISEHPNNDAKPATTGAAGTFNFERLEPGQYALRIVQRNYPKTRSGQNRQITIKAGEPTGPLKIELIPGAALSGRVLDEDGDPLRGCVIRLEKPGGPQELSFGSFRAQSSGDSGSYRVFDIIPGKYLVTAQCMLPAFRPSPLSTGQDPPPNAAYPSQTWPEAIDLLPGAERSGVDFHMKPAAVTSIRVTLGPAGNWRGRTDLGYQLVPLDAMPIFGQGGWQQIDTTKNVFEIHQVFPGAFSLRIAPSEQFRGAERAASPLIGAVQRIEVGDRPREVQVDLHSAVDVRGHIEFDEGDAAARPAFDQIELFIHQDFSRNSSDREADHPQKDGTFTIKSAFPGPCRLYVNAQGAFLKSAWLGNTELTGGRLDLSAGASGDLRIILSTKTASVRGTAPPGAQIYLTFLPTSSAGTLVAQADQNGQFQFKRLQPGRYLLGLDEPTLLSREATGEEITLEEGQTLVKDLKPEPNQ